MRDQCIYFPPGFFDPHRKKLIDSPPKLPPLNMAGLSYKTHRDCLLIVFASKKKKRLTRRSTAAYISITTTLIVYSSYYSETRTLSISHTYAQRRVFPEITLCGLQVRSRYLKKYRFIFIFRSITYELCNARGTNRGLSSMYRWLGVKRRKGPRSESPTPHSVSIISALLNKKQFVERYCPPFPAAT